MKKVIYIYIYILGPDPLIGPVLKIFCFCHLKGESWCSREPDVPPQFQHGRHDTYTCGCKVSGDYCKVLNSRGIVNP